jgi:phosphoribosylformylglycinamidine (FGAM) synthase-like enzyme
MAGGLGAEVDLGPAGRRDDEALFGEGGGRMLVSVRGEDVARLEEEGLRSGVRVRHLGRVGGADLVARIEGREVRLPLSEARDAYERGLPEALA